MRKMPRCRHPPFVRQRSKNVYFVSRLTRVLGSLGVDCCAPLESLSPHGSRRHCRRRLRMLCLGLCTTLGPPYRWGRQLFGLIGWSVASPEYVAQSAGAATFPNTPLMQFASDCRRKRLCQPSRAHGRAWKSGVRICYGGCRACKAQTLVLRWRQLYVVPLGLMVWACVALTLAIFLRDCILAMPAHEQGAIGASKARILQARARTLELQLRVHALPMSCGFLLR